jgi:hypothetical protein
MKKAGDRYRQMCRPRRAAAQTYKVEIFVHVIEEGNDIEVANAMFTLQ